jgi:hypothetical protein
MKNVFGLKLNVRKELVNSSFQKRNVINNLDVLGTNLNVQILQNVQIIMLMILMIVT